MISPLLDGKFELLTLPYAEDALAPEISVYTIRFHHGRHLQACVHNLNAVLPGSPLENLPLEEVVVKAEDGMRNNFMTEFVQKGVSLFGSGWVWLVTDHAEPAGYLACTQTPDGIIHLLSSRVHYRFNLKWVEQ